MAVPYFAQSSPQTCGAACLRMLLAGLGIVRDEATIAQACGTTPLGCTVQDIVIGAQSLGAQGVLLSIRTSADAAASLSHDVPFVGMIDLASLNNQGMMFQWHFVVALELLGNEVAYHDPEFGPDLRAPATDFLLAWRTAGFRGVRVWTP